MLLDSIKIYSHSSHLMKFLKILSVFLFFTVAAHAEITPEKKVEIEKLLKVTGIVNLANQMLSRMITTYQKAYPNTSAESWERFRKKLNASELIEQIVPLYDKYYTLEDLRDINTFYESPAGKKIITTLPSLTQESMTIGQEWGDKKAAELEKELEAEKEKLKDPATE